MMICGGRIELRRQQGGQADRPGADDGHGVARLHLAVQHAALEAGRQDVAQHDQRFFVGVRRERGRGSCRRAGCGRTRPACRRWCCRGSSRPSRQCEYMPFRQKSHFPQDVMQEISTCRPVVNAGDRRAHLLDDADALVPEDPAVGHRRHVALQDVQVGAADGGGRDPDDGVGRLLDRRPGLAPPRRACRARGRPAPSSSRRLGLRPFAQPILLLSTPSLGDLMRSPSSARSLRFVRLLLHVFLQPGHVDLLGLSLLLLVDEPLAAIIDLGASFFGSFSTWHDWQFVDREPSSLAFLCMGSVAVAAPAEASQAPAPPPSPITTRPRLASLSSVPFMCSPFLTNCRTRARRDVRPVVAVVAARKNDPGM